MHWYISAASAAYGKRTPVEEYKVQGRGGMGVKNYNITDKTGNVIAIKAINDEDLIMITSEGVIIRIHSDEIRACGRASQGVRLIKLAEEARLSSISTILREEESEEEAAENGETAQETPAAEEAPEKTEE